MTQIARPASDVSDGGWQPQPVYSRINEAAPDDTTFVSSPADPQGDSFEVKLQPLAYPAPGQETLTVRLRQPDAGSAGAALVSVLLLQGGQVITGRNVQPTPDFTDYALTLTDTEVKLITDYTDLRVRVVAGGPTTICCPNQLPAVLHATFSNGPDCLNGISLPMFYMGGSVPTWQTVVFDNLCSMTVSNQFTLKCQGDGTWNLMPATAGPGDCFSSDFPGVSSVNCSPLQLVWNGIPLDASCGGPATCTITITM